MGESDQGRAKAILAQVRNVLSVGGDRSEVDGLQRADWRFLLVDERRHHIVIVADSADAAGGDKRWRWLVDDGWSRRLSVVSDRGDGRPEPASEPTSDPTSEPAPVDDTAPDIVVVTAGATLEFGLELAGRAGAMVVEVPRSPRGLLRSPRAALADAGFDDQRRYLVTPDLDRPKRYTLLHGGGVADGPRDSDSDRGLRWLLGPPPLGAQRPGRAAALSAAGRLLRSPVSGLIGHTLVVARRADIGERTAGRSTTSTPTLPAGYDETILVTSGHDDGSRAVLLPIADGEPDEVLKISPRPSFNHNVVTEVATIAALRQRIAMADERPGRAVKAAVRHLPEVIDTVQVGPLLASRERYAGRWSAADLGYRRPELRADVLRQVLVAATDLAEATRSGTEPWSAELFDHYIAGPLDRYRNAIGRPDALGALEADLAERSLAMAGRAIPLIRRHYDLGPWNVLFDSTGRLTVIDWELAPPRTEHDRGLAGADHLYFAKYWLHIWLGAERLDDELTAFEFSADSGETGTAGPRTTVTESLATELDAMGVHRGLVPLIVGHLWLEKALYTMERRGESDPGRAGPYLDALSEQRSRLLAHWPA